MTAPSVTMARAAASEEGPRGGSAPAAQHGTEPPAALSCLARHYGGEPRLRDGRWVLRGTSGQELLWDDGRPKSAQERLDAPDLQDTLVQAYRAGVIEPVTREDWEPGRVRSEALLDAHYGGSRDAVSAALVTWRFRGHGYRVHSLVLPALQRVTGKLEGLVRAKPALARWLDELGGTFAWRDIAGTERRSAHSWGIAVDLNPALSDYWRNGAEAAPWRNRVPAELVDAFESEGFIWGGRWRHFDTMHFEYRPELFDPLCQLGGSPTPGASGPAEGSTSNPAGSPRVASSEQPAGERSPRSTYPWLQGEGWVGATLKGQFASPPGFERVAVEAGSFGAFLRELPLRPPGSPVLSFRGETILSGDDPRLAAVVELDVGDADLQQCADTVIRLHAEWSYAAQRSPIVYRAGDGTPFDFERYLGGERVQQRGARLERTRAARPVARSHEALKRFLTGVFSWVNTGALARYSRAVPIGEVQPGDFFVMSGSPFGHAVLVLDVARAPDGEVRLLLGQGYMPAQSLHVLRDATGSPWFSLDRQQSQLDTPFWRPFPFDTLRRL